MPEVTKLFQHEGSRTPETDRIGEDIARHSVLHEWPDAADIEFTWVHHHQPDLWLLFATGIIPNPKEAR